MASISSIQQVQVLKLHSAMHIALQQRRSESLHSLVHEVLLKLHTECRAESQNTHSAETSLQIYRYHPDLLSRMVRAHHSCPAIYDMPRLEGSIRAALCAGGRSLRLS